VCIVDKRVALRGAGIQLVLAVGLLLPKLSARDKEAASSADKTGERVTRQVRRGAPRDQIAANVG